MLALKHLASFATQLSISMKSGIPVNQALSTLEKTASTKRLRHISAKIREAIDKGSSLENAFMEFRDDFPDMFISLISAGEKTGHTAEVTAQLGEFYQSRYLLANRIMWELATTGFYLFICLCLIIFIEYVLAGWDISVAINRLEIIGIAVIFFILLPWAFYKNVRFFRVIVSAILLNVPFYGSAIRKLAIARFCSTMAMGINAGLDIRNTIKYSARAMSNALLERKALKAIEHIESGKTIAESLTITGIFPLFISQMFQTGELSGTMYDMMQKAAVITREQGENALSNLSQITARLLYFIVLVYVAFKVIIYWQKIFSTMFSGF